MTTIIEKRMTNIVAIVQELAPNANLDKTLDSLGTAWRRANDKGAELGKFDRKRNDLENHEINFIFDWIKKDKAETAANPQPPTSPPLGNEMRDEIEKLRATQKSLIGEKTTLINAYNAEKSAKESAQKTLEGLQLDVKLKTTEIEGLKRQVDFQAKSNSTGLSSQQTILNDRINSLENKLTLAEGKLERATNEERERADAVKVAHDKELKKTKEAQVEAAQAYQNQIELNNADWLKKVEAADKRTAEKEAEIAALNEAHAKELAPHLQGQTERDARVTILEVINYFEIFGAIVGAAIMFQAVGVVLGIPAALFYYDSMNTVKKATSWQSSQFAIGVCTVLSIAFAFVHFNSALTYNTSEAYPKGIVATVAAVISSGVSVAALYQNYLKKNENS